MIISSLPDRGGHSTILIAFDIKGLSFRQPLHRTCSLEANEKIMSLVSLLILEKGHVPKLVFDREKEGNMFLHLFTEGILSRLEFQELFSTAFFLRQPSTDQINVGFMVYGPTTRCEILSGGPYPMDVFIDIPSLPKDRERFDRTLVSTVLISERIEYKTLRYEPIEIQKSKRF